MQDWEKRGIDFEVSLHEAAQSGDKMCICIVKFIRASLAPDCQLHASCLAGAS